MKRFPSPWRRKLSPAAATGIELGRWLEVAIAIPILIGYNSFM